MILGQATILPFWKLLVQVLQLCMFLEPVVAVLPLSSWTQRYLCNAQYSNISVSKEKNNSKLPPCHGKDTYCIEADERFCNAPEGLEHVSEAVNSTESGDLMYMTRL